MILRVVAFALAVASAAPAFAQDPMANVADAPAKGAHAGMAGHGRGGGAMKACAADRKAYCGDVEKGGGRVMRCMKEHADKLSPGCKTAIATMRAEHKAGKVGK